jgi:DNA-binding beta-propeller fold protein YncE
MRSEFRLGGAAVLATALLTALAAPALAATRQPGSGDASALGFTGAYRAVFVQTDNPAGNEVVAYNRESGGTLGQAGAYATGGLGGVLAGSVVDHLASQGSLALSPDGNVLIAVNAGSNTISVFGAQGDRLRLRQVLSSGGVFPVSVAIHGDLVYVLNALDGGSVQGYRMLFGSLIPLPGSGRSLGLDPDATPQFTNTPGQVAFAPDGAQLVVTTKANGNDVDVFAVEPDGYLGPTPVQNAEPGTVPFGVTFDPAGNLVIAEAGTDAVETFTLSSSGTIAALSTAATNQAATCWVTAIGYTLFASNAGSATVSSVADTSRGVLSLLGQTGTDAGTVDSAATPDGRYLYVQTGGAGIVDEFAVGASGGLTEVGSVTVPGAVGGEGIAAS